MSVFLTLLLKPFLLACFILFVLAPLSWLAWRAIPEGRLRDILFKVRTGPDSTRRDKVIMTLSVGAFYAVLLGAIAFSTR